MRHLLVVALAELLRNIKHKMENPVTRTRKIKLKKKKTKQTAASNSSHNFQNPEEMASEPCRRIFVKLKSPE